MSMGCHFDNDSNYQDDSYLPMIKCLYCGEMFRQRYGGQEFCSSEHELLYHKALNETEKCLYCGKDFMKKHRYQKYCCPECRRKSNQERIKSQKENKVVGKTFICPCCGKEFVATNCRQKFCSIECRKKYAERSGSVLNNKCVVRMCKRCGKEFTLNGSGNRVFCCDECRIKWHIEQRSRERAAAKQEKASAKRNATKKRKKPKVPLSEVMRMAAEEHLSYGQIVQKYGL